MPRPMEFDRAEALVRAMHVFWEQGFERTTVRDLTKAMGISAPSLYNTFGDKKALFDEAVAEYQRSVAIIPVDASDEPLSKTALAEILDIAVEHYCSTEHPHGCFVITDPVLDQERQTGLETIRGRLLHALEDGNLAEDTDVVALADYIDIVLRGLSSRARDGADAQTLRAATEFALKAWPRRRRPR